MRRRSGPKRNSIGTTSSTASDCVHRSLRHQDVSAVAESTASGRRWRNGATAFTKKSRCDDFASKSIWRNSPGRFSRNAASVRSEEHTSELQSLRHLVCRLLLENKKQMIL